MPLPQSAPLGDGAADGIDIGSASSDGADACSNARRRRAAPDKPEAFLRPAPPHALGTCLVELRRAYVSRARAPLPARRALVCLRVAPLPACLRVAPPHACASRLPCLRVAPPLGINDALEKRRIQNSIAFWKSICCPYNLR